MWARSCVINDSYLNIFVKCIELLYDWYINYIRAIEITVGIIMERNNESELTEIVTG
jgi:hypothetical protein